MHHFNYQAGELYCENVPVRRIAEKVGTPFYLYSAATLEHHFRVFEASFHGFPHVVCFAVKANANLAILRLFGRLGAGADIVSGGELHRALAAGMDPGRHPAYRHALRIKFPVFIVEMVHPEPFSPESRVPGPESRVKVRSGLLTRDSRLGT